MDRNNLPYRRNCEGYLLCKDGNVIVRDTGKDYLEFPGGGVDENEDPAKALEREAYEEAGVILDGTLKKVNVLHFIWGSTWAKSEKQKQRYRQFKGEEMHFYTGNVKELVQAKGDGKEEGWKGEVSMLIEDAINKLESFKPFTEDVREYRKIQLEILKVLVRGQASSWGFGAASE